VRGRPPRAWPLLVVGTLILASCGETPAAETTTSSSSPTTVVATSSTTTVPTPGRPVALSDLVGRWKSESNAMTFDEGGSYELFEIDGDGAETPTGVIGFVALQGGQLVFATSANPNPCPGQTGIYDGELVGEILHLSLVEDPCGFREEAFASPFSPVSTPTTTGPEPVISDLSGSWENERSVLRVNDAGDFVVLGPDADPDRPLTGGFVAREEGNFIFVSGVSGECPGQTGVYGAIIEDSALTLTLVDDPCTSRVAWFEPTFTQAG